jgi:hypothetical protein
MLEGVATNEAPFKNDPPVFITPASDIVFLPEYLVHELSSEF